MVGWEPKFSGEGEISCLMCGEKERTTIVGTRPDVGICEACSVNLYWTWHKQWQDAEPADEKDTSEKVVKVVLSRLLTLASGSRANPQAPESYELGLVFRPDGGLDFPSADILPNESLAKAAGRALEQHGIVTWPAFVEPLYSALSPRGRMTRVVCVTAYTTWVPDHGGVKTAPAADGRLQWREWPPWDHARDLKGLYAALGDVWRLRIWKYVGQSPRPSEICIGVRRAAAEYIYLQQALRAGKKDVDTSAAEILRRGMSDDEKLVDRLLADKESADAECLAQVEAEKPGDAEGEDVPGDLPEEVAADQGLGDSEAGEDDPFADVPGGG